MNKPIANNPCKYSDEFLPIFNYYLKDCKRVLDPCAGSGKLAAIKDFGFQGMIYCNDLEPEWKDEQYPVDVWIHQDAGNLLCYDNEYFDGICCSPTYGNRFADHWKPKDKSKRYSYTFNLGHALHPCNTGTLYFGEKYKLKHIQILTECDRLLKLNGVLIWNISNHIKNGQEIDVVGWYKTCFANTGYQLIEEYKQETKRMRHGANGHLRTPFEYILIYKKVK